MRKGRLSDLHGTEIQGQVAQVALPDAGGGAYPPVGVQSDQHGAVGGDGPALGGAGLAFDIDGDVVQRAVAHLAGVDPQDGVPPGQYPMPEGQLESAQDHRYVMAGVAETVKLLPGDLDVVVGVVDGRRCRGA